MTKTPEKAMQHSIKYAKTHLKRVPLDLKTQDYEELQHAAERAGESVNGFIKTAIKERIDRLS
ncbi:MAG: hypothetical protein IJ639_03340 [Ruminococcus sp.]|nr:hypothetical protein [Ruminococcus sp.]MBR1873645.1 hypothetical protein [Eubacterium sp.]